MAAIEQTPLQSYGKIPNHQPTISHRTILHSSIYDHFSFGSNSNLVLALLLSLPPLPHSRFRQHHQTNREQTSQKGFPIQRHGRRSGAYKVKSSRLLIFSSLTD